MTDDRIIIKMLETVRPEPLFPGEEERILRAGEKYDAVSNPHGAICGICSNGEELGVKPGEFVFFAAPKWVLDKWMPNLTEVSAYMSMVKVRINRLINEIHENAVKHGWWDKPRSRSFGDVVALCHSELSEAFEEYRKGRSPTEIYYSEDDKPEGIGAELADVVIRIMDYCGFAGIDLESLILQKHEYNKTRPYRHGGKVL